VAWKLVRHWAGQRLSMMELEDLILEVRSHWRAHGQPVALSDCDGDAEFLDLLDLNLKPKFHKLDDLYEDEDTSTAPDDSHEDEDEVPQARVDAIDKRPVSRTVSNIFASSCRATLSNFIGEFVDSMGNHVTVCSEDAFQTNLVATLSQPPRPDIRLPLRRMGHGAAWHCGGAKLTHCGLSELHWSFPDGRLSIWKKKDSGGDMALPGECNPWTKHEKHDNSSDVALPGNNPWAEQQFSLRVPAVEDGAAYAAPPMIYGGYVFVPTWVPMRR